MKSHTSTQPTSMRPKGASLILSLLLVGTTVPLQARPPTPPEVVDHVKHRIGSIFNHIGRAIENATSSHDDEEEEVYVERRQRRSYPDERYYEPVPLRRDRVIPRDYEEDEQDAIDAEEEFRAADRERHQSIDPRGSYTPDYEYYRRTEPPPVRPKTNPIPANERPQDFVAPTDRGDTPEVKPVPKPEPSVKTEPSKPATPPASTTSSSVDEKLQYAVPVPNKSGFVYPPGMKQEPASMIDVRDMRPGQKVRDPRTGKIFLVP